MKEQLKKLQKPKLPKNWGKVEGTTAFNPVNYSDGTPSREVEEDWETSGEEEMQELYEKCNQTQAPLSVTGIRDHLNRIHSLVEVCQFALANKEWKGQEYCQIRVCEVLCD